jgi:putative DNA-invertase from lambdoid prophage Rac
MSRVFAYRVVAYARVSTVEQLTENQRAQIADAGYKIEARRYVEEKVSGSVPALMRPGFKKLMDKTRWSPATPTLVVTKLDRIGRDSIDVQKTVGLFTELGIRLIVLQLGNLDLTSSSGALMVKVLAAVADCERELIVERTLAGQARARAAAVFAGAVESLCRTAKNLIEIERKAFSLDGPPIEKPDVEPDFKSSLAITRAKFDQILGRA